MEAFLKILEKQEEQIKAATTENRILDITQEPETSAKPENKNDVPRDSGSSKITRLFGDWSEVKDTSGEIYFWNQRTDQVSWTRPRPEEAMELETNGNGLKSSATKVLAAPDDVGVAVPTKDALRLRCQTCLHKLNNIIDGPKTFSPQRKAEVELRTRFVDWQRHEISDSYLFGHLRRIERDLKHYEKFTLPAQNFSVRYDKLRKMYFYYDRVKNMELDYYPLENIPDLVSQEVVELD